MKFFGIICALLVLNNVYGTPVQTRSDTGAAVLAAYLESIPTKISSAIYGMGLMSAKLSSLPSNLQTVFTAFSTLLTNAQTIGTKLDSDLRNPNGTLGFKQLKADVNTLVKGLTNAVNALIAINPTLQFNLQPALTELTNLQSQLVVAVRGQSGDAMPLIKSLDDTTLALIQSGVDKGLDLFNNAVMFLTTLASPYLA